MAGIFKAYDIRGIYGETLTDEIAFRSGARSRRSSAARRSSSAATCARTPSRSSRRSPAG